MGSSIARSEVEQSVLRSGAPGSPGSSLRLEALLNENRAEVLEYLSQRPIHTVCMASYIRDHGVVSPHNRGVFFGCRNERNELEGVALVGHATLLETQNDHVLLLFAKLKRQHDVSHLVRGEHEMISRFWKHFAAPGHAPHLACRELLFAQHEVALDFEPVADLRPASLSDLDDVLPVNAEMVREECGIDPLQRDPAGFRQRLERRIQKGRVWVLKREERLIFKADVFAETPEMIYIEGVNVRASERRKGYGSRCMLHLGATLLKRSQALCLLLNDQKKYLTSFYERIGYRLCGTYDTIYLDGPNQLRHVDRSS
jgi:predicted GNAT family acetyltransferase